MEYTPKELDNALSLLPSDGETAAGDKITDPKMYGTFKYLEAKGLVYLREPEGDIIVYANLSKEGVIFVEEGGFTGEKKDKENQTLQKQKEIESKLIQLKKTRRMMFWSAIAGAVFGGLIIWLVQKYL